MSINDGGPAFPNGVSEYALDRAGMTLRDWFAGQALPGLVAHGWYDPEKAARLALDYADAMLAAREAR